MTPEEIRNWARAEARRRSREEGPLPATVVLPALAEVLRLPREDRVRVAEELFVSLEEPDEDVAAAWAGELERRSRDLAAGRVRTVPWETVRARIMNELEQRRAGRASS